MACLGRESLAGEADPHRFALLSDIHIPADPTQMLRGINMADHLKQAIGEIIQSGIGPSAAMINGDCAYLKGLPGDYATLVDLLKPLREAGLPIHLAMGNHDSRENFWQALPADQARNGVIADRQILVLESPRANWIMLDSLDKTNRTPGKLGPEQLKWLAEALDARANKPAIVLVHHDPQSPKIVLPTTVPTTLPALVTGLTDTEELLEVLKPRKQIKALIFGHTHVWSIRKHEGIHLINLPAVAYVFKKGQPSGWSDVQLHEDAMTITLHCLDKTHPWHGESHKLDWRA